MRMRKRSLLASGEMEKLNSKGKKVGFEKVVR
jgi:hypothetical protein